MANIFDVKDSRGKTVYCDSDLWHNHVLMSRPFMKNWVHEIVQTIKKPDYIVQDAIHPNRNNYYRSVVKKRGKEITEEFIKVVVEFADQDVGNLITAFPDNNKKPNETIIWTPQKPK